MTAKRPHSAARGRLRPIAPSSEPDRHSFRKGDIVSVFRLRRNGLPVMEGWARIIRPVHDIPNLYCIVFVGERRFGVRFVHPALQGKPDGVLSALIDLWRYELDPETFAGLSYPSRQTHHNKN